MSEASGSVAGRVEERAVKYAAMNVRADVNEDRPKRFKDDNGFLHVFLRFMRTGILEYMPETYEPDVPEGAVGENGRIPVLVTEQELSDPDSLASLQGMYCLQEHEMITPEGEKRIIGAVAGEPQYVTDGGTGYVQCEAVITDAETIQGLEDGSLVEVSAAYHHDIQWGFGSYNGEPFAGEQRNIRYNHFVLLHRGEGRAGPSVMVVNSKEKDVDRYLVWSRKQKRAFVAQNQEEAEKLAEELAGPEPAAEPAPEPAAEPAAADTAVPEAGAEQASPGEIKNLTKVLEELKQVKARASELEGQLQAAQEKIAELLGGDEQPTVEDAVENEAEAIAEEREEAADVMEQNGLDKKEALNSMRAQKLRGTAAKAFALNSVRAHQGKEPLTEEQAADAGFVNGMFGQVKEYSCRKTKVIGGLSAMNAADVASSRKEHLRALGFDVQ